MVTEKIYHPSHIYNRAPLPQMFSLSNTQSRCQAKRLNSGTNQMMISDDAEVQLLLLAKKNVLFGSAFLCVQPVTWRECSIFCSAIIVGVIIRFLDYFWISVPYFTELINCIMNVIAVEDPRLEQLFHLERNWSLPMYQGYHYQGHYSTFCGVELLCNITRCAIAASESATILHSRVVPH